MHSPLGGCEHELPSVELRGKRLHPTQHGTKNTRTQGSGEPLSRCRAGSNGSRREEGPVNEPEQHMKEGVSSNTAKYYTQGLPILLPILRSIIHMDWAFRA